MIVETRGNSTVIIAENGKCLVRKGTEQTIDNNDTTIVYLAKSLTPSDYEERDKMVEEEIVEND